MLDNNSLFIYGTGTIAEIATFYFETDSDYKIEGYIDEKDIADQKNIFLEKKVFSWEEIKKNFPKKDIKIFVAIGYKKTNRIREEKFKMILNDGYSLASYISSKATVLNKKIGLNCFILENNVVQPFVEIGDNVYLWSGNHIGHHSLIDDNTFIASHVVISGKCKIGKNCFFGVNSCLRDGCEVGSRSVVGSGAMIMKSCPDNSVFIEKGTDSRVITKDII